MLLVMGLMGVGAYQLYGVFSNEGYMPQQPITYSHVLHAGVMKMECLYCHHSAETSAHAGVPAVDVCMGCHSIVQTQSPEIQKLTEYYESGEPVPWVRIHRLPDHSYFSHQWHVKAGVSCQTCHGPIENMPVVKQWQKLEMGACMECHRQDNYIDSINHPPTWYGPQLTSEQIADARQDMMGQRPDDGPIIAETLDGGELYPDGDAEFTSIDYVFEKYYADAMTPVEGQAMKNLLEEYQDNLYMHGWNSQIRGQNASVECNICHN